VEPWFRDRKLALGIDFFRRESDYYSDEYTLGTIGGSVSLSKPLTPFLRGKLSYTLQQYDVSDMDADAPIEIQREEGNRMESTVGITLTHDTRDQYFIPTRGTRTSVTAELSGGPFGAETDIYFLELKSSRYWSLLNDHVFNLRGAVQVVDGYSGDHVPIFNRLFLGGPRSLRGFEYRDVSPRSVSDPDEPIGGNTSYYLTAEYTVPLWSKIRGAIFYDIGAVNKSSYDFASDDLNSDVGVGLRFDLPMFPLNLDYAFPHMTDDDNDGADPRWNFQLGYSY
jgi:outer membrane protein insertion porin family